MKTWLSAFACALFIIASTVSARAVSGNNTFPPPDECVTVGETGFCDTDTVRIEEGEGKQIIIFSETLEKTLIEDATRIYLRQGGAYVAICYETRDAATGRYEERCMVIDISAEGGRRAYGPYRLLSSRSRVHFITNEKKSSRTKEVCLGWWLIEQGFGGRQRNLVINGKKYKNVETPEDDLAARFVLTDDNENWWTVVEMDGTRYIVVNGGVYYNYYDPSHVYDRSNVKDGSGNDPKQKAKEDYLYFFTVRGHRKGEPPVPGKRSLYLNIVPLE